MYSQNSAIRKLGKFRNNERTKKFTSVQANRILNDDWEDCDCCNCYIEHDHDYPDDNIYEWDDQYLQSRQYMFYKNIRSLKTIFTDQFLLNLKDKKSATIDRLKVNVEISFMDLIDKNDNDFFHQTFDENNKYGMRIYASINYADYDLSKIKFIDIHIEPSFKMAEVDIHQHYFKFNIYFMQSIGLNNNKKKIYRKINGLNMPEWCQTSEEKFMYYFLSNRKYNKALKVFDIKDVIKDLGIFQVFKMYIN